MSAPVDIVPDMLRLPRSGRRWGRWACLTAVVMTGTSACGAKTATTTGTRSQAPSPAGANSYAAGQRVFASAGCGRCHTLAAVHSTGTIGPDLDQLQPAAPTVEAQVTDGGGGMPAFAGKLSQRQIEAVADFVSAATRRDGS